MTPAKHQRHQSVGVPKARCPLQQEEIRIKYSVKSRRGFVRSNPSKPNQDSFFAVTLFAGSHDAQVFGVCDGHGPAGHLLSRYVSKKLPQLLSLQGSLHEDPAQTLKKVIAEVVEGSRSLDCDTFTSGTTLVLVLLLDNNLYCANIGDSRAILCSEREKWTVTALSRDHKPSLYSEKKRVEDAGGRVESFKAESGEYLGPLRVWMKHENASGLALSRAIGDRLDHQIGVISEPEIFHQALTSGDKFIVLGSDGLFEFLSNEAVMKAAIPYWKHGNPLLMSNILVNNAHFKWARRQNSVDDITTIVVFL